MLPKIRSKSLKNIRYCIFFKALTNRSSSFRIVEIFSTHAFSSLVNYVLATEGEVYVLKNPAWSNWYKIGKAIESVDRCNQYQTGSPHRDYEIVTYKKFKHRGVAEKMAHSLAESLSRKRANEWFYIENLGKEDFDKMLGLIDGLIEEKIQNDRTSTN